MESKAEGTASVRGRGGYRQPELRTIPANVSTTRATDVARYRQIDLLTNYVPLKQMPNRPIYKYRVDFEPPIEDTRKLRAIFHSVQSKLFSRKPIYDSASECRSSQKLDGKTKSVTHVDNGVSYLVKFTNTGACTVGFELLQVYNMQMREFLDTLGFYSPQPGLHVHPGHFDEVGQDIMMLRGFRTAINIHDDNELLLNLEACHKIMQRPNVLQTISRTRPGPSFKENIRAALTGKLVVTPYGKKKTCYRIEDVDFEKSVTDTFEKKDGTRISFVDYYRTQYNITIRDLKQPLLKVIPSKDRNREGGDSRVTVLVPELCNQAGLTEEQRNNHNLKRDLIRASQVSPENRAIQLREFLQTFHSNTNIKNQLENWGYQYEKEPRQIKAHVIPMVGYACHPQDCLQGNYNKAHDESADIRVNSLAVAPTIKKMVIITARNQLRDKLRLIDVLKSGLKRVKLSPASFEEKDVPEGDSASHYIRAIRSIAADTNVAVVIIGSQNKEKYDAIKKAASVERGLITQVVTSRLLENDHKAASAALKIAIQVAAKVGGEPWWVDIPVNITTMVCGYDTYHDTAKRGRSYGAFVASLNNRYSRWWSKADDHERLEEISSQMSINISSALNAYKKHNSNKLPTRIVIYRDGVGDGQLGQVYKIELEKIKEAVARVSKSIKLTMVIVNKRIGARFYARTQRFSNPPPGTVIDHTVTRAERYDFYLISQSTRQGTVTPTYYNIIHDESGFSPEIHQKLAFKLCLLYYNWAGTVRVPAPCQYAHKLALLCGEHLHSQPNAQMDDKLHFL